MSVVVLGNDYCPYCRKVANYLTDNKVPFNYVDTETEHGKEERKKLSKQYNHNTIPMVFINGQFVGGCDSFFAKLGKNQIKLPS